MKQIVQNSKTVSVGYTVPTGALGADSIIQAVTVISGNAKAVAAGLKFRPHAETSKDTLAWWKTTSELRRAKMRAGLTKEREAEVLAAWKAESTKSAG